MPPTTRGTKTGVNKPESVEKNNGELQDPHVEMRPPGAPPKKESQRRKKKDATRADGDGEKPNSEDGDDRQPSPKPSQVARSRSKASTRATVHKESLDKIKELKKELIMLKASFEVGKFKFAGEEEDLSVELNELQQTIDHLDPLGDEIKVKREERNNLRRVLRTLQEKMMTKETEYEKLRSLKELEISHLEKEMEIVQPTDDEESDDDSVLLSTAVDNTERWVAEQVRFQEEGEDKIVAEALQKQEDEDAKAIEQLKIAQAEKRKNLEVSLKASASGDAKRMKMETVKTFNEPPSTFYHRMLEQQTKMLARQSSASMSLPTFDGQPDQWPLFINEFRRTTHDCGFTNSENLLRLRKCLRGEALASVQMLMVAPENVPSIVDSLEGMFGDSDFIIKSMTMKLRKYPSLHRGKPEDLIGFGMMVAQLTSTITTMKNSKYLSNPAFMDELEGKLSLTLKREWLIWIKRESGRNRDLANFTVWVQGEVTLAREMRQPVEWKTSYGASNSGTSWRNRYPNEHVNATGGQEDRQDSSRKKNTCFSCGKEGHFATVCRSLLSKSPEGRFAHVNEKKLCRVCFIPGHTASACRKKRVCGVDGCTELHNQILHRPRRNNISEELDTNSQQEQINIIGGRSGSTVMGALPVIVKGPLGERECLAFLDSGSSVTLMEESLASEIGLSGDKRPFCMMTMGVMQPCGDSRVVSCSIRGSWDSSKFNNLEDIRTIKNLPLEKMTQDAVTIKREYPYLSNVHLPSYFNEKPKILLGRRHQTLTADSKIVGGSANSLSAFRCKLGWTLGGRAGSTKRDESMKDFQWCNSVATSEELHELVKKSFSTEEFGVQVPTKKMQSPDDKRALQILQEKTVKLETEDRYATGLLWKTDEVHLPDSFTMALSRLHCQEKRMDTNPELAVAYCSKIDEYLQKGFCRKLSPEEAKMTCGKTWYLPHFGVLNPNKPGKMRLVYDARAKSSGVSLNDMLLSGPDLNQSLVAVLLRFRQYAVAYSGDIRDMFHRVYVLEEDRQAQRFLWRGMERERAPDTYEMTVMTFGATSSPCSAQFVKNYNADLFAKEYPVACDVIKRNFYVDDVLHSSPTVEKAKDVVRDVIQVQKKGGFEVCNWRSNSREVLRSIPTSLRSKDLIEICDGSRDLPEERILGMWWNPSSDKFNFRLTMHRVSEDVKMQKRKPTKREILRVVMSLYDPLGLLGHFVVRAKILLQDIWRSSIEWDDSVNDALHRRWTEWMNKLHEVTKVNINRSYSLQIPTAKSVQLHIFCDASEKAFAAVVFLRVEGNNGVDVTITASKTRVTPLKPLSVARLELQGALLGTRLAVAIKPELDIIIDKTVYWTDSMTVLKWIRSDARTFKTFIGHRVGEILESTSVEEWRYVPSEMNVADDATRDAEECDLHEGCRWFCGPAFLRDPEETWPIEKVVKVNEEDLEMKLTAVVTLVSVLKYPIDFQVFSNYKKLLRTISAILRLKPLRLTPIESTTERIRRAERIVVRLSQQEMYAKEKEALNGGKPLARDSKILQLEPFLDDQGILRVTGRLGRSNIGEDFSHPMIMDANHHVTQLILEQYHSSYGHVGHKTIANEVRQKFWVPGLLNAVKKTSRKCVECQKRRAKPSVARMADLPVYRLKHKVRPFTHCGLDFFGPLIIKHGRKTEKRWGALFTCMSTRAVHLELAAGLMTDHAINVVTRMSARRGLPLHIYCDNGTNFHGADNELRKSILEIGKDVANKMAVRGVQWHFNPPAAPHMGGAWERLVGSVKRAMEGILKEKHPTEDTLQTIFCEAEWIVNSRPLTTVSVDPSDPSCLTPNHFLIGWSGGEGGSQVPQPVWGKFDESDGILRKQYRVAQRLADEFWVRWRKEYLPTLTNRSKWLKTKKSLNVNDVVIVVNDLEQRNNWPMGRIVAVFPGRDGEVRVVEVKTAAGVYKRPAAKVIKLHLQEDEVPSSGGRMWGPIETSKQDEEKCADAEEVGG